MPYQWIAIAICLVRYPQWWWFVEDDLLLQEEEEKWEDLTANENGLDETIGEMEFDDPAELAYEEDVDSNEEDISEEKEEEEEYDDDEEEEEKKYGF